uniref:15-oxoprostaglandin 13-reductase n=1 Tax=Latimeria chalumnae TaxID=7897 RepID=H3AMH7_LATCH
MTLVQRIVLNSRPGKEGEPVPQNFRLENASLQDEIGSGEVKVKTFYLSVDPYMVMLKLKKKLAPYVYHWNTRPLLDGKIIFLKEKDTVYILYKEPEINKIFLLLMEQPALTPVNFTKVDPRLVDGHLSYFLGAVGLPGLTALLGIREKGHVIQGANQTVVISGAAGACGSLAGQIARLEGCSRVVGICGSDEKCRVLVSDVGFDAAINYKTESIVEKLQELCPAGADVYFDNVGGKVSDAVISKMNPNSHVILCGQISQYNKDVPYPPPLPPSTEATLKEQNITRYRLSYTRLVPKYPIPSLPPSKILKALL